MAGEYIGDYADNAVVRFSFNTYGENKAPITLAGVSTQSHFAIKKDGTDMTLDASTITVSVDDGSVTGYHVVTVDMGNDDEFEAGSDYEIRLTAGTVDSISAVGTVLKSWSCEKRTAVGVSIRGGAIGTNTFVADTFSTDVELGAAVKTALDADFSAIPAAVINAAGITLTASGTPTTTEVAVSDAANLSGTQLTNALILHLATGATSRITNVTGSAPALTLTLSPALPSAPAASDELVVFGKYLASL